MSSFSVLSDRGVSVSAANCYHPQRLTQLEEEGVGIVHALETIGGTIGGSPQWRNTHPGYYGPRAPKGP